MNLFINTKFLKLQRPQFVNNLYNFFKQCYKRFAQKFEIYLSAKKLLLVVLTGIFILGLLIYLFSENLLISTIFSPFGIFIFVPINDLLKRKRRNLIENQILEFLSLLNITLRAGLTIRNGLEICSKKIKPPLGEELKKVINEINIDIDILISLHNMASRIKIPEIDLIVSAIEITGRVGGNVTEIFSSLINIIRERQNLKEEIRVFTTQGRLSGNIISFLPLGYFILFYIFESEHVKLVFSKTLGVTIVLTGLLLNLIGYLIIRGITKPGINYSKHKERENNKIFKKFQLLFKEIIEILKRQKLIKLFFKSKNFKNFLIFYNDSYKNFNEDLLEKIISMKIVFVVLAMIISIIYSSSIKSFILILVVISILFFFMPDFYIRKKVAREGVLIDRDLPNVIDELNLSCKAGLNLRKALYLVTNNTNGLLGRELKNLVRNLKLGKPKQEAFNELIGRTESSELKSFISALIQGEIFGVPISEILGNQAKDCRLRVHKKEEQRARKIPILILFPLIFFILPGFLTIAVGTFIFSILNI